MSALANAANAANASAAAASASAAAAAAVVRENEAARQELTRVVKEGYLKKLGAKVKSWKSRYFRLVGYVLSYHESREQLSPVLGEVHLINTLVKQEPDSLHHQPYTFSVTQTQADCRTYYMVAADKEVRRFCSTAAFLPCCSVLCLFAHLCPSLVASHFPSFPGDG